MTFKFVALFALLAVVNAGGIVAPVTYSYAASPLLTKVVNPSLDAVASTQQNVVRSLGGTVSTYSKSVDTPYSSVRKTDTRINNNVYAPAVAKTLTYAASAPSTAVYAAHSPAVYAAPSHTQTVYAAPAAVYAASTTYAAPAITKTIHSQQSPVVYSHAAPAAITTYNHGPSATTYSHIAPGVTSYGTSQTVHYSPAEQVSHMSFDGFGTQWGF